MRPQREKLNYVNIVITLFLILILGLTGYYIVKKNMDEKNAVLTEQLVSDIKKSAIDYVMSKEQTTDEIVWGVEGDSSVTYINISDLSNYMAVPVSVPSGGYYYGNDQVEVRKTSAGVYSATLLAFNQKWLSYVVRRNESCQRDGVCEFTGTFNNQTTSSNYVYYSGILWRIIRINDDNSMVLMTEEPYTTIAWGESNTYKDSYVRTWLNSVFLNGLNNPDKFVRASRFEVKMTNSEGFPGTVIQGYTDDKVGLISSFEYRNIALCKTPGEDCDPNNYINRDGKYMTFWTLSPTIEERIWQVNSSGNSLSRATPNSSASVRPLIYLKTGVQISGGIGIKTIPYTLVGDESAEADDLLNTRYPGEYLQFGDEIWRIVSVDDAGNTKIILNEPISEVRFNNILKKDYSRNIFNLLEIDYNKAVNIGYYLNDRYINKLADSVTGNLYEWIVPGDWYLGGYSKEKSNYLNTLSGTKIDASEKVYVGLIRVGEMFSSQDYPVSRLGGKNRNLWTLTPYSENSYEINTINKNGGITVENTTNTLAMRPVIILNSSIKIESGKGIFTSPYLLKK